MKRLTLLAATLCLGLTGCDLLQGDKVEANGSAALANASAGNATAAAAPSDAGLTSSRSLAGLAGPGDQGTGGKDPNPAIEAGARGGAVDPRLVGLWSDSGDCKDAVELRPDGTFLTNQQLVGRWQVEGGDLVFSGNGNEVRLRLDSVEPNRIVNTDASGHTGQTVRC